VALFAHIGGFLFGVFVARAFLASRETARSRSESLSFGDQPRTGPESDAARRREAATRESRNPITTPYRHVQGRASGAARCATT
jgi:hypothetical protein